MHYIKHGKTTPSKNNAMPYKVYVWNNQEDLDKLFKLVVENNINKKTREKLYNPYFDHIKTTHFYLLTIHQRVARQTSIIRNL